MNTLKRIVPARIKEAREARGMSMADFANLFNISRQAVSKYERGIMGPSEEILQAMSNRLGFPIAFFYKDEIKSATANGAIFFRSNANIPKKVKNASKYQTKWMDEIKTYLDNYVDFPHPNIPINYFENEDFETISNEDIEEFSLQLRELWDLGLGPIDDLIGILENQGIIIAEFSGDELCQFKGIDAFSCWRNGTPYILYNSKNKSAVRVRFSILHELGHLIFHNGVAEEDSIKINIVDIADAQADRFAAAFLMPATTFPKDVRRSSIDALLYIKQKWGVSYSTIIRRCQDLDILSENQINYLKRQMTINKYWRKEPLDDVITFKGPEIIRDAILMLIENRVVSRELFLNDNSFSIKDLKSLCSLPDNFINGYVEPRQKPILKVIESNTGS